MSLQTVAPLRLRLKQRTLRNSTQSNCLTLFNFLSVEWGFPTVKLSYLQNQEKAL